MLHTYLEVLCVRNLHSCNSCSHNFERHSSPTSTCTCLRRVGGDKPWCSNGSGTSQVVTSVTPNSHRFHLVAQLARRNLHTRGLSFSLADERRKRTRWVAKNMYVCRKRQTLQHSPGSQKTFEAFSPSLLLLLLLLSLSLSLYLFFATNGEKAEA